MAKMRIYVDMDGTLATWDYTKTIEDVSRPGYYRNCVPMQNMIDAVKQIMHTRSDVDVYILSAVLQDDHSAADKAYWLDKYLPEVPVEHRIFAPYGSDKSLYVKDSSDVLLDDFSKNLHDWQARGGKGIKVLNGINWTHKTWLGDVIDAHSDSKVLAKMIIDLGSNKRQIQPWKPKNKSLEKNRADFENKSF